MITTFTLKVTTITCIGFVTTYDWKWVCLHIKNGTNRIFTKKINSNFIFKNQSLKKCGSVFILYFCWEKFSLNLAALAASRRIAYLIGNGWLSRTLDREIHLLLFTPQATVCSCALLSPLNLVAIGIFVDEFAAPKVLERHHEIAFSGLSRLFMRACPRITGSHLPLRVDFGSG